MKIIEITDRTPDLMERLLEVWESSVRATHLFLLDDEIKSIKEYVPQALNGIAHLIIAEDETVDLLPLWELRTVRLKCCLSPRKNAARGLESA